MDYLLSILAGIVQGLTEFLPISSSGHLLLFHEFFNFDLPDEILYDVFLHLGTLAALVIFFCKDIEKIIRGFLSSLVNWNLKNNYNQRLAWLVVMATIPAALAGYFFEDFIDTNLRSPVVVAVMLIVVGILFLIVEKKTAGQKDIKEMSKLDSILIGLAQVLALIPGTSRSGITIIAGLGRKIKREQAARFSFLMSMPIILGAGVKKLLSVGRTDNMDITILLLGGISAAVTGYFAVKYLIKYLTNHSLNIFAWYRLIIGCLILIWAFLFTGV
jgi:undecaprenyl-diphosphatase